MTKTYIRFERGRDDLPWLTLGPFDWVQLTYDTLRISEEGEPIAFFNKNGDWEIVNSFDDPKYAPFNPFKQYAGELYSDIVIYGSTMGPKGLKKENEWYNTTPGAHETACKTSEQLEWRTKNSLI